MSKRDFRQSSSNAWGKYDAFAFYPGKGQGDGAGSVLRRSFYGYAFARARNLTFLYQPIRSPPKHDASSFPANFTGMCRPTSEPTAENIFFAQPKDTILRDPNKEITRAASMPMPIRRELRTLYNSVPSPEKPCPYDIAIHIRMGDISMHSKGSRINTKRYIPLVPFYGSLLKLILTKKKCRSLTVGIYSEGTRSIFAALDPYLLGLENERVFFELDTSPRTTFHHFVTAPALVMATSSFSQTPGLLRTMVNDVTVHLAFSNRMSKQELRKPLFPGWIPLIADNVTSSFPQQGRAIRKLCSKGSQDGRRKANKGKL